jgi:hypothetical protein
MGDPEHPTGLMPCLAQRHSRSQEGGGKADGGGTEHVGVGDPAPRHILRFLFLPSTTIPDRHCTAPAPILFSEVVASKHRPKNPTCNLERCMWQCRYDYSTFAVAVIRLTWTVPYSNTRQAPQSLLLPTGLFPAVLGAHCPLPTAHFPPHLSPPKPTSSTKDA